MPKTSHGKTPIGGIWLGGIFSDGGGIVIYPGHDGKIHVKHIPPWQPVFQELGVVASLMAQAQAAGDSPVGQQLRDLAQSIVAKHGEDMLQAFHAIEE